jgi:hypothetical protein
MAVLPVSAVAVAVAERRDLLGLERMAEAAVLVRSQVEAGVEVLTEGLQRLEIMQLEPLLPAQVVQALMALVGVLAVFVVR